MNYIEDIKKWLSSLDREKLEGIRTKCMIAFFIGLFCWLGGALLLLLIPNSWLLSSVSFLGKIVFWVCLIAYILSGIAFLLIPSKKWNKRDEEDIPNLRD